MVEEKMLRKLVLFVALPLCACSQKKEIQPGTIDAVQMENYLNALADSLHASLGVSFFDLETGQEFHFNEKELMHAASTMKVPLMIELFRQAEANEYAMDDSIIVKNEFRSIVDGSAYSISDDSEKTLYEKIDQPVSMRKLNELMITMSSNLATNLLIEKVEARRVMQTMAEIGANDIQVLRGVEDLKAYRKGWSNRTTAFDMMLVMRAIAEKKIVSEQSCDEMISILKRQHFRKKIPAGVPVEIEVASKTGNITAIDHDCAIVFPKERKPYVLVVLTKGVASQETASEAIAAISKKIYESLRPVNDNIS